MDMGNATTAWVASRSKHPSQALSEGNVIEVFISGPNPCEDAESYAWDETFTTGKETYVYCVEIVQIKGFEVYKEVNAFVPPK